MFDRSFRKLHRKLKFRFSNEYRTPKLFAIGFNKTGTTTLSHSLKKLGYKVGKQREAEFLHYIL